jgi:pSer/pThr/pTyr-binding forkhead associated (FHA) protein
MQNRVLLEIVAGPLKGKKFEFAEHDTFIFGRAPDCHAYLSDDTFVSRHHFILEVNPPLARLRDLGSLNATYVNNRKCGGRKKGETPEEGAKRQYPEVDLILGDRIRVGDTIMEVTIEHGKVQTDESAQVREELARLIFEVNAPKQKKAERFIEQQVGGYIVEKELGRGGFGAVYLARRIKDNMRIALKVMLSQVAVGKNNLEQFLREIRNVSSLKHPNIVEIFDFGSTDGIFYFAMEWCEGGGVDRLMAQHQGKVTLQWAKPIILQSLEGLAHAHSKGFVHRDLKPCNILLSFARNNVVARLGDFGLAKSFEKAGLSGLTLTGNYAGTPYFVPREQITNFKYVKPVSDVWSMGATIYNMLTGAVPYPFNEERDPIDVILNEQIIPIHQRDRSLPKPFAQVIDRAISDKTKDRYQTAGEMLKDLKKALSCSAFKRHWLSDEQQ